MRYWDSSALVALHVQQSATDAVRQLFAADPVVLTWTLSDVEMRSGIMRLSRQRAMTVEQAQVAIARLESFWEQVHPVALVDAVKLRAKRLLGVHAIRATDAMQLAAALTAVYDNPIGWDFVCLDRALGDAARREGFFVVP
jgi:predicted nucleic acid-binding protein